MWYQGSAHGKAWQASSELPKLKEMLEKQQKQIDKLEQELEKVKKERG
jgi:archaellum component FlaC